MSAPPGSKRAHLEASDRDKSVRRALLRLSLANWVIAVVAWTISAYLGITSPASIIVYSVLFVIGLVAAIVAILTYLLEKFGHRPSSDELGEDAGDGSSGDADEGPEGDAAAAGGDTVPAGGDSATAAGGGSGTAAG